MRHNAKATIDDYLAVITRKTASLFAAGGKVAADLAGADAKTITAMVSSMIDGRRISLESRLRLQLIDGD